jgi:hypothetical protein
LTLPPKLYEILDFPKGNNHFPPNGGVILFAKSPGGSRPSPTKNIAKLEYEAGKRFTRIYFCCIIEN